MNKPYDYDYKRELNKVKMPMHPALMAIMFILFLGFIGAPIFYLG